MNFDLYTTKYRRFSVIQALVVVNCQTPLSILAPLFPGVDFAEQFVFVGNALSQALRCQHRQVAFSNVEPTTVLL